MRQQGWVLRCHVCQGGRMYFVEDVYTESLLDSIIGDEYEPDLLWKFVQHGPIDDIWTIDYCRCREARTGSKM